MNKKLSLLIHARFEADIWKLLFLLYINNFRKIEEEEKIFLEIFPSIFEAKFLNTSDEGVDVQSVPLEPALQLRYLEDAANLQHSASLKDEVPDVGPHQTETEHHHVHAAVPQGEVGDVRNGDGVVNSHQVKTEFVKILEKRTKGSHQGRNKIKWMKISIPSLDRF